MNIGVKIDVDTRWAMLAIKLLYVPVALGMISVDRACKLVTPLIRLTTIKY